MIPGDELTWGHTLFNRKNRKDIYILLQLVPCTNRMEKKCVCKRPVYKLVPGATWICGKAILKRIGLLFTLIYNKKRMMTSQYYMVYPVCNCTKSTASNFSHSFFFSFFFFHSVWHKYDYLISLGLDFMSLKHLCFLEPASCHCNFHSMYISF